MKPNPERRRGCWDIGHRSTRGSATSSYQCPRVKDPLLGPARSSSRSTVDRIAARIACRAGSMMRRRLHRTPCDTYPHVIDRALLTPYSTPSSESPQSPTGGGCLTPGRRPDCSGFRMTRLPTCADARQFRAMPNSLILLQTRSSRRLGDAAGARQWWPRRELKRQRRRCPWTREQLMNSSHLGPFWK